MNFLQQIPPDSLKLAPVYIAIALGVAALAGVLIANAVNRSNTRSQLKCEIQKWLMERREVAYKECLNHLARSRTTRLEGPDGPIIDREDFLARLQNLQYVPVWTTVLVAYASDESKTQINKASETLTACMDKARQAAAEPDLYFISDNGLTAAIDDMLKTITECTKTDLTESYASVRTSTEKNSTRHQ